MELTQKYTLIGVSFFDLSANEETISIHDFAQGVFTTGDQIQVQNAGGSYDVAIWNGNSGFWSTSKRGQPTEEKSEISLKKGDGVWLITGATATDPISVTFKGKALLAPTATYEFGNQYKLISLPVHAAIEVNSTKLAWTGVAYGDQVQVPNAGGSYDVAVWNDNLGYWCTSKRGQPTETESTLSIPPYSSVWLVSTASTAECSFDAGK